MLKQIRGYLKENGKNSADQADRAKNQRGLLAGDLAQWHGRLPAGARS